MNDVELWGLLTFAREDPASTADLTARIRELASLPLADRRPFFHRLAGALAHPDAPVRAAAARALSGAGGAPAFRALVAALSDPDPDVRAAAVTALAACAGGDAGRWAHALFHPDPHVRGLALDVDSGARGVVPALWLLADPVHHEKAANFLTRMRWDGSCLSTLLEAYNHGRVDAETTRYYASAILRTAVTWLFRWCSDEQAAALLADPRGTAPDPGVLGRLLDLGWDVERAEHAPQLLARAHQFNGGSVSKGKGVDPRARERYTAALVAAAVRHAGAPAWALEALVTLHPPALGFDWLPADGRRRAALALLEDPALASPLDVAQARALLDAAPCRRADGALDLPVAGAVARLASSTPIHWLVVQVGAMTVIDAFLAAPGESAPLLRASDRSKYGRSWLIAELQARAAADPRGAVPLLGLLLAGMPADALDFLARLDGDAALALLCHYVDDAAAASALSGRTIAVAAGHLGAALSDAHVERFLDRWLASAAPRELALGLRVLGRLATRAIPFDGAAYARSRGPELVRALLAVVDHCAGFPHEADRALAEALQGHADPAIARWAAARLVAHKAVAIEEIERGVPELHGDQLRRIEFDADLGAALAPAIASPVRGLVPALAGRAPERSYTACTALIGCHDPIDLVARELARFGEDHKGFLRHLDDRVEKTWQNKAPASLSVQAWLSAWERHAFALADAQMKDADALGRLLDVAATLAFEPLGDALFTATRHVLAAWRWRDPARFSGMLSPAVLARYAAQLPGRREIAAAAVLGLVHAANHAARLEPVRELVRARLLDLSEAARAHLSSWMDARGLTGGPPPPRAVAVRAEQARAKEIAGLRDLDALVEHCAGTQIALVTEASLRLVELGEVGVARLAGLLERTEAVPAVAVLAESVALWPEGAALNRVRHLAAQAGTEACLRFLLSAVLIERGERAFAEHALAAACAPALRNWFRPEDHERLQAAGLTRRQLALALAASPHGHAYRPAVDFLLTCGIADAAAIAAVRGFLACGTERLASLRLDAARWLGARGDATGEHLMLGHLMGLKELDDPRCLVERPALVTDAVESALIAGGSPVMRVAEALAGGPMAALERVLGETSDPAVRAFVLQALDRLEDRSARRATRARQVAEAFAWAILRGRELTGRMFHIEMIHGDDELGWTVPGDGTLHVNPLALLRGEARGRLVVEGLGLHEVGHQLYHAGEHADAVRQQARREHLGELLNLVADEHLERNLAARSDEFRDRFRALSAWAFQHARRDVGFWHVLQSLGFRAFDVLVAMPPEVARTANCVRLSGGILRELERRGSSFARFFRALRLGLGNRHGDARVAAALALFRHGFRHSTMDGLLEIARRLRELFPLDVELLGAFGQHPLTDGDAGEIESESDGLTNDEVSDEVERVINPRKRRPGDGRGKGKRVINVGAAADVNTIHRVVPLRSSAAEARALAALVARHARLFRRFLVDLGRRAEREPRRMRGRSVDRAALPRALIRRDPRILEARRLVVRTDLFLGVVIDCSGSMGTGENIERARRFGALLAEAARGIPGIDVRLFGFTDCTIYDAGDADHPAVHALVAGGGNDDAAALLHVANVAEASRRRAKLIVMISDGLPTECSVETLRRLVHELTRRHGLCLAQVAVRRLEEVCFEHHVVVETSDMDASVRAFGGIVARLVRTVVSRSG